MAEIWTAGGGLVASLPVDLFDVVEQQIDSQRQYAVRKLTAEDDGLREVERVLFGSIEAARSMLASRGLTRIPRGEGDEPSLLETWL